MPSVRYHPDGFVIVKDGDQCYLDTSENFAADYGSPFPALPEGCCEVYYNPVGCRGEAILIHKADGAEAPQVGAAAEAAGAGLAAMIGNLPALLAAQATRRANEK